MRSVVQFPPGVPRNNKMEASKERKLYEAFPRMYRLHKRANSPMECGFVCGDGWFDIIWKMSSLIEPIVVANEAALDCVEPHPMSVAAAREVREYDGYLRVTIIPKDMITEEISDIIDHAERESIVTCEACGSPARAISRGDRTLTLCEKHAMNER